MKHPAIVTVVLFLTLALLALLGHLVIYRLIDVPGAVSLALGGVLLSPWPCYFAGRRLAKTGVIAAVVAGSLVALPLSALFLATKLPYDKFALLTALGYWSIPLVCLVGSLYGWRAEFLRAAPNNSFKPNPLRGSA